MHLAMIDVFFLIILAAFAIITACRGFVKAIFGKISWIIGLLGAFLFYGKISPYLVKYLKYPIIANIAAFILVFIVIFVVIKIIETLISKIFSGNILKSLDRALGLFFGLLEGVVVVFVIVFILTKQPWFDVSEIVNESYICNLLAPFVAQTQSLLTKDVA